MIKSLDFSALDTYKLRCQTKRRAAYKLKCQLERRAKDLQTSMSACSIAGSGLVFVGQVQDH